MKRIEHGWRFYAVPGGEIGINRLRRPKFYPGGCRLNSVWITRRAAAKAIQDARHGLPS